MLIIFPLSRIDRQSFQIIIYRKAEKNWIIPFYFIEKVLINGFTLEKNERKIKFFFVWYKDLEKNKFFLSFLSDKCLRKKFFLKFNFGFRNSYSRISILWTILSGRLLIYPKFHLHELSFAWIFRTPNFYLVQNLFVRMSKKKWSVFWN